MPPTITHIAVPLHCQDTSVHCGYACVTMLLDYLSLGRAFQPRGTAKLANLSQVMMHMRADLQFPGNEYCTKEQMVWLLSEEAPAGRLKMNPNTGNPGEVLLAVEQAAGASRPVAVRAASGGHWVVVHGRSRENGDTTGYFMRNPWVDSGVWAYGSTDSKEQSPCTTKLHGEAGPCSFMSGDDIRSRASKHFTHKRGGNCPCPGWTNQPSIPRWAIEADWIRVGLKAIIDFSQGKPVLMPNEEASDFESYLGLGNLDYVECIKPLDQHPPALWKSLPQWPTITIAPPNLPAVKPSVEHAIAQLLIAGLLGNAAPAEWTQEIYTQGDVVIRDMKVNDFPGTLFMWREINGKRLAARYDHKGALMAAGILSHWPDVPSPKDFTTWCGKNTARVVREAGRPPLQGAPANFTVDPTLHWRHCDQSASMWWPFYKVRIDSPGKAAQTVYMNLAKRVYTELTGF